MILINVKKFIQKSDKNLRRIVKKIIKNTSVISKKEFFKSFRLNIKHLLSVMKNKKLYVFIDRKTDYKKKSNYWLLKYLKFLLKIKITIIDFSNINKISKKLQKDDTIIFIDDCIYSGNQLGGLIGNFMNIINENNNNNNRLILYILVPYISKSGEKNIKEIYKNNNQNKNFKLIFNKNKNQNKIKNSSHILTKEEIDLMNKYYPRNKNLIDSGRRYFEDKSLIIFYHKLADMQSTIPLFYKGLVPNEKNLKLLETDDFKDFDKLEIIPLIKDCIDKNLNDFCPVSPYKK